MDIERLKELTQSEDSDLWDYKEELIALIDAEIARQSHYGAKLCPFCAGEATMRPEGDYWEITCDDCGVFKQGDTYEQALNEWNRRIE